MRGGEKRLKKKTEEEGKKAKGIRRRVLKLKTLINLEMKKSLRVYMYVYIDLLPRSGGVKDSCKRRVIISLE